jgi:hypothetical protein
MTDPVVIEVTRGRQVDAGTCSVRASLRDGRAVN